MLQPTLRLTLEGMAPARSFVVGGIAAAVALFYLFAGKERKPSAAPVWLAAFVALAAYFGHPRRDRQPDPFRGPGHDRHLPGQIEQ